MFDYSVFDKPKEKVFDSNPRMLNKKRYKTNKPCDKPINKTINNHSIKYNVERVQVRINIRLYQQKCKTILIYKDESLEDLSIKMYNAVYPDFSTEKNWDIIPPPGSFTRVPRLYYTSVINKKEEIMLIPVHKFISLASFMQANPSYFVSAAYFGPPTYNIYVLDELAIEKIDSNAQRKNVKTNYYQKFVSCIGK
jgi:hypothetical protein